MKDEVIEMEKYFDRLWSICRSITGNGLRESFAILKELIPLNLTEVPSGTKIFDWEIPQEWNINDAFIITPEGKKICDFRKNNLHVVNYSEPIDVEISFDELNSHLYSLPDHPEWIPYVTSYYKRNWGFCIPHAERIQLSDRGKYKVFIDSELKKGSLTYGDFILKGESEKEILFTTYLCHPSMANNELSGPLALAFLYKRIRSLPNRKYTYRFVVAPETIGAIAYLQEHGSYLQSNLVAGYVLTCCGDSGKIHFKRSKTGNSYADQLAESVLKHKFNDYSVLDFSIGGSDERQYCSPGFNLPVGSIIRTPYQRFKEYHTSADNKDFISFNALSDTVDYSFEMVQAAEADVFPLSTNPFCEPQLGKRGLYSLTGGTWGGDIIQTRKLLHLLAFADGKTSLRTIAERWGVSQQEFSNEVEILKQHGLLK